MDMRQLGKGDTMSEDSPEYVTGYVSTVPYRIPWKCARCGEQLGMVVNGEVKLYGRVYLQANAALVICGGCGAANTWPLGPAS